MDLRYLVLSSTSARRLWAGFRRRAPTTSSSAGTPPSTACSSPCTTPPASVRCSPRAASPTPKRGPKSFPPVGYGAQALVIADRRGRELLAGTLHLPDATRLVIVIAEGELTSPPGPPRRPRARRRARRPRHPVARGTAAVAARIPDGATVLIATDLDNEGEKYAALVGRALCRSRRAPALAPRARRRAEGRQRLGQARAPLALAGVPYEPPAQRTCAATTAPLVELDSIRERAVDAAIRALEHEPRIFRRSATLMRIVAPGALLEDLTHRDEDFSSIVPLQSSTLAEYLSTCGASSDVDSPSSPVVRRSGSSTPYSSGRPGLPSVTSRPWSPRLSSCPSGEISPSPATTRAPVSSSPAPASTSCAHSTGADVRGAPSSPLTSSGLPLRQARAPLRLARLRPHHAQLLRPPRRESFFLPSTAPPPAAVRPSLAGAAVVVGTGQTIPPTLILINRGAIDDRELRKEILSWAISARRVICFDNFAGAVPASGELERAVTSMHVAGRVLGGSCRLVRPLRHVDPTGNNVGSAATCSDASCTSASEPHVERPEERTFARAFDPYVSKRRLDLTRAALILLRAYCEAGRPDQHLPSWGRSMRGPTSSAARSSGPAGLIPTTRAKSCGAPTGDARGGRARAAHRLGPARRDERTAKWVDHQGGALAAIYPQSNAMGFEEPTGMPNMQAAIAELLGEPTRASSASSSSAFAGARP